MNIIAVGVDLLFTEEVLQKIKLSNTISPEGFDFLEGCVKSRPMKKEALKFGYDIKVGAWKDMCTSHANLVTLYKSLAERKEFNVEITKIWEYHSGKKIIIICRGSVNGIPLYTIPTIPENTDETTLNLKKRADNNQSEGKSIKNLSVRAKAYIFGTKVHGEEVTIGGY
jgi:hypothetical protein